MGPNYYTAKDFCNAASNKWFTVARGINTFSSPKEVYALEAFEIFLASLHSFQFLNPVHFLLLLTIMRRPHLGTIE